MGSQGFHCYSASGTSTGPFSHEGTNTYVPMGEKGGGGYALVRFSAAAANTVYSGDNLQPKAIQTLIIIKV